MKKSQLLALYSLLLVALLASCSAQANAQTFFNPGLVTGEVTLGSRLSDSLGANDLIATASVEGINFNVSATSDAPGGARFRPGSNVAGVDSLGLEPGDGDAPSVIENFETLTFTFTFDSDTTLELVSLDFFNISDSNNSAFVQIADDEPIELFSGVDGFLDDDGDSLDDIYTPAEPISISSGDSIIFSRDNFNSSRYGLQGLTFNIGTAAAVPEPSSILMLGLGSVLTFGRRRRS